MKCKAFANMFWCKLFSFTGVVVAEHGETLTLHTGFMFMSCQVSFHVPLLRELFLTVWTLKRFRPVVAELVSLQAVQGEKTLRALRALVRTLPGVRAGVHVQVTLAGEALATVGAGVRHLSRVSASVQQQLTRRQKRLPARGA